MNKLIIISGPTASGKSYLAESLLDKFKNVILLNADSMQVYKDLPILSAQPSISSLRAKRGNLHLSYAERKMDCRAQRTMTRTEYNLYSFLNFDENCSVGLWLKEANKLINDAFRRSEQPVIVGGTGLYLKALLSGLAEIPATSDDIRNRIKAQFTELGKEKFHEKLKSVDQISANKIHPNDSYRMQRAMEVYEQTGQPITSFKTHKPHREVIHISIDPDRETLYKNCDTRFNEMLKEGVEQEVRALLAEITNKPGKYNIENTLGYRSLVAHYTGTLSLEDAIKEAKQSTRNYAKRQCTWFRNQLKDKISLQYESTVTEVEEKLLEIVSKRLA